MEALATVSWAAIKWLATELDPSHYGGEIGTNLASSQVFHPAVDAVRRAFGDRIAGTDGSFAKNHNVERAVRTAQVQATRAILARFVVDARRKNRSIDLVFASNLRNWLGDQATDAASIKLSNTELDALIAAIDAPFVSGKSATLESLQTAAEMAVFSEIERAVKDPPPAFRTRFFHGAKNSDNWFAAFGSFLAKQIKHNADFRSIFTATRLAEIGSHDERLEEMLLRFEKQWSDNESLADRILPTLEDMQHKLLIMGGGIDQIVAQVNALTITVAEIRRDQIRTFGLNEAQIESIVRKVIKQGLSRKDLSDAFRAFAEASKETMRQLAVLRDSRSLPPSLLLIAESAVQFGNIDQAEMLMGMARASSYPIRYESANEMTPIGGRRSDLGYGPRTKVLDQLLSLKVFQDFKDSWMDDGISADHALTMSRRDLERANLVNEGDDPRLKHEPFAFLPDLPDESWRKDAIEILRQKGLIRVNCAILFPAVLATLLLMADDLQASGVDIRIDYADVNSHNQLIKLARWPGTIDFMFAAEAAYFTFGDGAYPKLRQVQRILACHGETQWTFVKNGAPDGVLGELYVFHQSTADFQFRIGRELPTEFAKKTVEFGEQIPHLRRELPGGAAIIVWEPLAYIYFMDSDYHLHSNRPFRNWVSLFANTDTVNNTALNLSFQNLFVEYWRKLRVDPARAVARLSRDASILPGFAKSCGFEPDPKYSMSSGTW